MSLSENAKESFLAAAMQPMRRPCQIIGAITREPAVRLLCEPPDEVRHAFAGPAVRVVQRSADIEGQADHRPIDRARVAARELLGARVLPRAPDGADVHLLLFIDHQNGLAVARDQGVAAVQDLLEHGLGVRHRVADHLQHLGGGRLPLERLPVSLNRRTFSIAITAWSAKDCGQCDVGVAEGLGLVALEDQHAQALFAAQQGQQQRGAAARHAVDGLLVRRQVDGRPVRDVQRCPRDAARATESCGPDRAVSARPRPAPSRWPWRAAAESSVSPSRRRNAVR